jgi:hypothetical protein
MNKENVTAMLDSIEEMFDTAKSVRGPEFTQMVRFVGTLSSTMRMLLREIRTNGGNTDEETNAYITKAAAYTSSVLCAEHAKALGVKAEDLQEVFKLVDNIEEKIHNGLK